MDQSKLQAHQSQRTRSRRGLLGDQHGRATSQSATRHDEPDGGLPPAPPDAQAHGSVHNSSSDLLARADARDAAAERRDRDAEDRDKVGGSDPDDRRRQAALDRLHAARDREYAAADRAELLAVLRSYDTGQDSGSTGKQRREENQ